jgi:hypothetical protein
MGSRALSELRTVLVGSISHDVITGTAPPVMLISTRSLNDLPPQEQRKVLVQSNQLRIAAAPGRS